MASHLRCLLFHGNGDFRGRVLARIGGLYKTHNAVNGILRNMEGNDNEKKYSRNFTRGFIKRKNVVVNSRIW